MVRPGDGAPAHAGAAVRLRDTDAKLLEIALDVGYESEVAFSRAFKREVGMAPGAGRRERRGRG